jgi:hypothetical protein
MADKIWKGSPTYTYIEQLKSDNAKLVKYLREAAEYFRQDRRYKAHKRFCDIADEYEVK